MSGYHMHAWCPQKPEEGVRSPGAGVIEVTVNCLMRVLGIECTSSTRAANALKLLICLYSPFSPTFKENLRDETRISGQIKLSNFFIIICLFDFFPL